MIVDKSYKHTVYIPASIINNVAWKSRPHFKWFIYIYISVHLDLDSMLESYLLLQAMIRQFYRSVVIILDLLR